MVGVLDCSERNQRYDNDAPYAAGDFYYSKPRFLGSKVGMVEAHAIIYDVVIYKSTAAAIKVFYAT